MTKRIFFSVLAISMAVLVAAVSSVLVMIYGHVSESQKNLLEAQIEIIENIANFESADFFENFEKGNYRITLVSSEGDVIFDSHGELSEMGNHIEREEITEAIKTGKGEAKRYSETLSEEWIYSAKKLSDGNILRVAVSGKTVFGLFGEAAKPVALIFIGSVLLCVFLSVNISKKIVEPLNEINLDNPLENKGYEELSPLLRRIDAQQKELKKQEEKLLKKKNELEIVLENMEEGIILLTQEGKIVSMNPAAKKILKSEGEQLGNNLSSVCRDLFVTEAFSKAASGEHFEKTISLSGGYFCVDANPVFSGENVFGVALFLSDVTEKENLEQLRREFTANVSHELKTPIHSITGFSELMASGIMREEDYVPCAKRIHSEAKRMARLVEDIINLSHLDENAHDMKFEQVDLYSSAESVIKNLDAASAAMDVEISLSGEHAKVNGIPELLEGIIFNLCDNAIKYNRKGGKVEIFVSEDEAETVLSVKDTGIGIPKEHFDRIFERFYRVDKSHSREVGGTGLGLSIVKHGAKIHGAKIELESTFGEGTEVSVRFPKN